MIIFIHHKLEVTITIVQLDVVKLYESQVLEKVLSYVD